jgi:CMP-N,N'-diacetyllegionaminic acid synthase
MRAASTNTMAVIPARGGSRSIPRKNLVLLGGRPLLTWSIDAARAVPAIGRIVVSTEDDAIAQVARHDGAEVDARPAALATDDAVVIDVLRELLARLTAAGELPRTVVLLEPTCPLRSPTDIVHCLDLLDDDAVDSVATFTSAALNPVRAWRLDRQRPVTFIPDVNPWLPRQQLPPAYQLNGAVYAFRADRLKPETPSILFGNAAAVIMPPERSVDIDDGVDLMTAEAIIKGGSGR